MSNAATEEAAGLSGVPVSQVQEGLVRDRGAKHRKQAQMARRRILHSTHPPPRAGCWKRTSSPLRKSRGQGRSMCVIPLRNNNEIKRCAASQAPAQPCVHMTWEVLFIPLRERGFFFFFNFC